MTPLSIIDLGRLPYDVSEAALHREFETFGPIKTVRCVHEVGTDKPRGYAFIEFHSGRDMKTAFKQGDGKKIGGRRVVVDVERGRLVTENLVTTRVALADVVELFPSFFEKNRHFKILITRL